MQKYSAGGAGQGAAVALDPEVDEPVNALEVDRSWFPPLLAVHMHRRPTDQEFTLYLEELQAALYTPGSPRRVLILDGSRHGLDINARQRRQMAEWMHRHDAQLRKVTVGSVFILRTRLARCLLTAVLWMQPMAMPYHVCVTMEEALDWAEARLKEHGIAVPSHAAQSLVRRSLPPPAPEIENLHEL